VIKKIIELFKAATEVKIEKRKAQRFWVNKCNDIQLYYPDGRLAQLQDVSVGGLHLKLANGDSMDNYAKCGVYDFNLVIKGQTFPTKCEVVLKANNGLRTKIVDENSGRNEALHKLFLDLIIQNIQLNTQTESKDITWFKSINTSDFVIYTNEKGALQFLYYIFLDCFIEYMNSKLTTGKIIRQVYYDDYDFSSTKKHPQIQDEEPNQKMIEDSIVLTSRVKFLDENLKNSIVNVLKTYKK
jgi:hypothetical protein